jgi:hypothetical protein
VQALQDLRVMNGLGDGLLRPVPCGMATMGLNLGLEGLGQGRAVVDEVVLLGRVRL